MSPFHDHVKVNHVKPNLVGGGFKQFVFSPLFGEMIRFDKYFC